LFVTTAINGFVTLIGWQRQKTKSGLFFALGMTGITLWTLAAGLGYAAVPLNLKIFFAKLDAVGYNSAVVLFFFTALYIAGLDEWADNKWLRVSVFFLPISNIILIGTNDFHHWVWQEFTPVGNNIVVFQHGPGFTWVAATGYLIILLMIVVLWRASIQGSVISRTQARLLLYATLIPVAANIVYLYGIKGEEGVDWSSVTFLITGVIFLYALYGQNLMDITPIARDILMNNMSDGMIVLDTQHRIIDVNRKAVEMIGVQLLGARLDEIELLMGSLAGRLGDKEQKAELVFGDADSQYYDALVSPLPDKSTKIIGHLVIIRNMTSWKNAELALEQRLLEIQRLHNELQDTQEQVVDQQRTLAAVEERRRLARNMHDSVNQSIHGLMLFTETLIDLLKKNQTETVMWVAERIQESGRQALREIRLMLFEINPQLIKEETDLMKIINERLRMVESRVGINAQLVSQNKVPLNLHVLIKENLYWMAIEALNNAIKHGQPKNIKIIFNGSDSLLKVEIADDGLGFDINTIQAGGFGMTSMRERADLLGGELNIESEPGNGTRVKFQMRTGVQDEDNQDPDR